MNFNESSGYTISVTCVNTEWNMLISIETVTWGIQAFIRYILTLLFISEGMQLLIIQGLEKLVNANHNWYLELKMCRVFAYIWSYPGIVTVQLSPARHPLLAQLLLNSLRQRRGDDCHTVLISWNPFWIILNYDSYFWLNTFEFFTKILLQLEKTQGSIW